MIHQQGDVLSALPEVRQGQVNDMNAVEEIIAEYVASLLGEGSHTES